MVQVKGVMPPRGGITRETPTGSAVEAFGVWHNFYCWVWNSYVIFKKIAGNLGNIGQICCAMRKSTKGQVCLLGGLWYRPC